MKSQRDILIRLIFVFAVLFCFGISAQSNFTVQPCNVEVSTASNSGAGDLSFGIDYFEDDQINHSDSFGLFEQSRKQHSSRRNSLLINEFSYSVWQPPKKS